MKIKKELFGWRGAAYLVVAIFLIVAPGICAQDNDFKNANIGILDLKPQNVDSGEVSVISTRFANLISMHPNLTVIERSNADEILKEQGFQQTGCVTSTCAVEAGQLLGATHMIFGTVGKAGETYSISARIIDVKLGKIIKTAFVDCRCQIDDVLSTSTAELVAQLFGGKTSMAAATKPTKEVLVKVEFELPSPNLIIEPEATAEIRKIAVYVDGKFMGDSGFRFHVTEGPHTIDIYPPFLKSEWQTKAFSEGDSDIKNKYENMKKSQIERNFKAGEMVEIIYIFRSQAGVNRKVGFDEWWFEPFVAVKK